MEPNLAQSSPVAGDEKPSDGDGGACWSSLRKKAVVVGAVIAAAPVVIPPLVVFSLLALALAFPSAFYLASFACADKLMSSLLVQPEQGGGGDDEDDDDDGDEHVLGERVEYGDGTSNDHTSIAEDEQPPEEAPEEKQNGVVENGNGKGGDTEMDKEDEVEERTRTREKPSVEEASDAVHPAEGEHEIIIEAEKEERT